MNRGRLAESRRFGDVSDADLCNVRHVDVLVADESPHRWLKVAVDAGVGPLDLHLAPVAEARASLNEPMRRASRADEALVGSSAGLQSSQSDRDEPAERGLRRQVAGCCQGVDAVARELVRSDIVPDVAGLCALRQ
jgi:hypothetical protein